MIRTNVGLSLNIPWVKFCRHVIHEVYLMSPTESVESFEEYTRLLYGLSNLDLVLKEHRDTELARYGATFSDNEIHFKSEEHECMFLLKWS